MTDIIKQLNKFGRSVYLKDGDWSSKVYKAFVQPLRYKNKMYMSGSYTQLGHFEEGYYLYIGPSEHNLENLSPNARIVTSDLSTYEIQRSEKVYLKDNAIYIWAIIKEK